MYILPFYSKKFQGGLESKTIKANKNTTLKRKPVKVNQSH